MLANLTPLSLRLPEDSCHPLKMASRSGESGLGAHSKTFMKWINVSIGKRVFREDSAYEELENGVVLIELLRSLSPDEEFER